MSILPNQSGVCPIIELEKPHVKKCQCTVKLNGKVLAGAVDVRWGHEGTIWGCYQMDDDYIRFTGRDDGTGAVRLNHYHGCESLGDIELQATNQKDSKKTWLGTYTTPEGQVSVVQFIQK